MKRETFLRSAILAAFIGFIFCLGAQAAFAQTTAFTYQGRFTDTTAPQPTNGTYAMKFELYSEASGTNLIDTVNDVPVTVVNNIFTAQLNFAAANAFDGTDRFLKISVKRAANEQYTALNPLQPITSTPYSIKSKTATTADTAANAQAVGGTPAAQIVKEGDARLSDARQPSAGSANYIQNTTAPQTANFNVSGSGVIGGSVGIGTTAAPTNAALQVGGGVLARGGAPSSGSGANNNGYAFGGSGGDDDSGMFSTADGTLQFYTNSRERIRLTRSISATADNGANGGNTGNSNPGGAGAGIILQSGSGGGGGAGGGFEFSSGGGAGAGINLIAGNGGGGGSSGNGGVGGAGAGITLQGGTGGQGGGAATEIRLQGGTGGDGSVNFNGGNGADITLQAGNGGRGVNFRNGGNGASITLQPGIGGSAGTSSVSGTNGNIILAPTSGNVGIGTTNPTTKLSVTGDLTVTGTINGTVTSATNATNATNAANADKLDNIDSSQFVQTNNTTTFIRNQTTQQTGNFNITGNGAVGGNLSAAGNVITNGNLFAVSGGENLRVVRGVFQVNNGIVTIISGSGFSVTRNGVGSYSINFTTAFSNLPAVSPSVVSGATIIGTSALGVAGTTITAFSPNGNPGDPSFVMFIAIGSK